VPQNNVSSVVSTMINSSAMKNISSKAKEELEKKKKKCIQVKLVCVSLMLGYNKIRELTGLNTVLDGIMDNARHLQWIDISHNYLVTLDYSFEDFPHLKTLYLHCNFVADLAQLDKLKHLEELKTFTIHGNPLTSVPNFRILTISILTQLKKLDSVLISKKERDNAVFIRSQTKKYPLPKNPPLPPQEKKEEDEEDKE
jgi:Leucine-rich repeat (LRR) protein